jgi:hypothetical protein
VLISETQENAAPSPTQVYTVSEGEYITKLSVHKYFDETIYGMSIENNLGIVVNFGT